MNTIKIKDLDEEIYTTTTKDGLKIYVWKNPYAHSFYLSLNVNYGSNYTDFIIKNNHYQVPQGIAHFIEHLKFNISANETANDLFEPLGTEINAFTTFKYTSYLAYGINDYQTNLKYLLDFVLNPYFTKELIKKEKGIIISEANMSHDEPYNKLFFEFNKSLYHYEKYREYITGEVEDIKKITLKDINAIYNYFYHPQNMFLVVTGNINPYEIASIVEENLSHKHFLPYTNPKINQKKEPKNIVTSKKEILSNNVEVPKAKIGLKLERSLYKDFSKVKLNIIFNLILAANFGDSSDFKDELLKNGLITFMSTSLNIDDDYIVMAITIESKIIDEAISKITAVLNNLTIDEDTVKRLINSNIATLVLNYEDVEQVNMMIQDYIINFNDLLPNIKDIYENISLEDVQNVLKRISTSQIAIVKLLKDSKE